MASHKAGSVKLAPEQPLPFAPGNLANETEMGWPTSSRRTTSAQIDDAKIVVFFEMDSSKGMEDNAEVLCIYTTPRTPEEK
jgi:hypothetical protein